MVRTACIFRVLTIPEGSTNPHYRCLAGDVEFVAEEGGSWICDDCPIPELMAEEHCLYLEPGKRFLRGTDSVLVLRCTKFDTILPDQCQCRQCSSYTCFNAH